MQTLLYPKETKSIKEHKCNFCAEKIIYGEVYIKSTHKFDGIIYGWKTHKHCANLAEKLKMYDYARDSGYEGVTTDFFMETINSEHDDLLINLIPNDEAKKYSDIIQQLRKVRFKDKLGYVIRYYKKLDNEKQKTE